MAKSKLQKLVFSAGSAMSKLFSIVKLEKIIDKADPNATVKRVNNLKKIAVMIGILILILLLILLLLHSCQDNDLPHGSVDIPGNVIDPQPPEKATLIELTAKDGYDTAPFSVQNMLPGDSVAQYYCVSVTHDGAKTVCFGISVDTAQKLSEVMRVKMEQLIPDAEDKVLYDGLMRDCTALEVSITASAQTVTPIYYRITVYTNGAEVGNEYVGESLTADFSWQLQ